MIARWIKYIIAFFVLAVAVILPYRWRVKYSDLLGKFINFFYQGYIKLLTWFFKQLEHKND